MSHRYSAYKILLSVLEKRQPLDEAFKQHASDLPQRDKAFVQALVMLCLRRKGEIDAIISTFLKRALPDKIRNIHHILSLGIAQIQFMETSDHAAVSTTVDLAKTAGFEKQRGLINAILRSVLRATDLPNDSHANIPQWLYENWLHTYGKAVCDQLTEAHRHEPPLDITIRSAENLDFWAKQLDASILINRTLRCRAKGSITELPGFAEGAWWVQDAAAALPATLLGNLKGKAVLDMCAAPGGKTLQLIDQGAIVTAVDRSKARLKRLEENLERTGMQANVITADASQWGETGTYDAILLDAPCSATGTLRRNPDVAWNKNENDIKNLGKTQTRILQNAVRLLKPGGILVYCTCSLQKSEEITPQDISLTELTPNPIGADELYGWEFAVKPDGTVRTLPCYIPELGGMDGFYIARFIKQ